MTSNSNHSRPVSLLHPPKVGLTVGSVLLSLLLLFVQSAYLVHVHESGMSSKIEWQVDCDICLKFGSTGEALVAKSIAFKIRLEQNFPPAVVISFPFIAVPASKARAPPIV